MGRQPINNEISTAIEWLNQLRGMVRWSVVARYLAFIEFLPIHVGLEKLGPNHSDLGILQRVIVAWIFSWCTGGLFKLDFVAK